MSGDIFKSLIRWKKLSLVFSVALLFFAPSLRGIIVDTYDPSGSSPSPQTERFSSGYGDGLTAPPVPNTSPLFFGAGYDWSGVGWATTNSGSANNSIALIGPRTAAMAHHTTGWWEGQPTIWLGNDGNLHTNYFANTALGLIPGTADADTINLTAPIVPSAKISYYPILDLGSDSSWLNDTNYLNQPLLTYGWTGQVGTNYIKSAGSTIYWTYNQGSNISNTNYPGSALNNGFAPGITYTVGGDSDSPTFIPFIDPLTGKKTLTIAGPRWAHDLGSPWGSYDSFIPSVYVWTNVDNFMAQSGYSLHWVAPTNNLWTGGVSGSYGTAGNWQSGAVTTNSTVMFASSSQRTIDLGGGVQQLRGMLFQAGGGGYTFNNGTFYLNKVGIVNADTSAQTINANIVAMAPQNWNGGAGGLYVNGSVNNGGYLLYMEGTSSNNISGVISGTGGLAKDGSGILSLGGANTFTGEVFVHNGTLLLDNATAVAANRVYLEAGTTLDTGSTAAQVGSLGGDLGSTVTDGNRLIVGTDNTSTNYLGNIMGSGGVTKTGTGAQTLSGTNSFSGDLTVNNGLLILNSTNNTYAGGTIITGGTLQTGATNALPLNGSVTVSGTLNMGSYSQAIGALNGAGTGVITNNATLTVGGNNAGGTYSGIIAGTGNLTKVGNGTLNLNGVAASTYTGVTTISGGTLDISQDSNLGAAPGAPTPGNIVLNGGTLEGDVTFTLNANRGISLSSSTGTINVGGGAVLSYNGVMAGSGNLVKSGAGTLNLGGTSTSTYTGSTTISAGTLQLGGNNALPNATAMVDNSTFDLNNFNQTIGSLTGAGTVINIGVLGIGNDNSSFTCNVPISGGGTLNKVGTGTVYLTGNNTQLGGTTVSAGILQINADTALGNAAGPFTLNGGTWQSVLANQTLVGTRSVVLGAAGGTVDSNNLGAQINGVISGGGNLTKVGLGTLTLTGANTYTGNTIINNGTVAITADNNLGTAPGAPTPGKIVLNGGTLEGDATFTLNANRGTSLGASNGSLNVSGANILTYNGVMAGSGNFTKSGTGTLILGGASAYTGSTTISAGTLQLGAANSLPSATAVTDNATLNLNGFNQTIGALSGSGTVNNIATFQIGNGNGSGSFSGTINGAGTVVKVGSGTNVLSGVNTQGGGTQINGGDLQIIADSGLGAGGVSLVLNGGALQAGAALSLPAARGITLGAGGGTVDSNGYDCTIAGAVTGAGGFTKMGSGALTLSNAAGNTYSGATQISGGELRVDGNVLSSAFTVNSGGTLGGNGTLASLVNNGTVRPGDAATPATLNVAGNYTQGAGGGLTIKANGVGAGSYDVLAIGGTANLGGTIALQQLPGLSLANGAKFTGVLTAAAISGQFGAATSLTPTLTLQPTYSPTRVDLTVVQDFSAPGFQSFLTPAELNVGAALNQMSVLNSSGMQQLSTVLDNMSSIDQIKAAYDQILPSEALVMEQMGASGVAVQMGNIQSHLVDMRVGLPGGYRFNRGSSNGRRRPVKLAYNSPSLRGIEGPSHRKESPWDLFIEGSGSIASQEATPNQSSFDSESGGMTTGFDYHFDKNLIAGMGVGYAYSSAKLGNSQGNVTVDTLPVSLFSMARFGQAYLDSEVGYAANFYHNKRNIQIGTINQTATSAPQGREFNALVEGGYDFHPDKRWTLEPALGLQGTQLWIDPYTEKNAGVLNLAVDQQTATSIQSSLGTRAFYRLRFRKFTLVPQISVFWRHEFKTDARTIQAHLAQGTVPFAVQSDAQESDYRVVGTGFTLELSNALSVYLNYESDIGLRNSVVHQFNGGLNLSF